MKVDRIETTPVNIPLEAPYLWSEGSLPGFTRTIVRVTTNDGITGLGESVTAGVAAIIDNQLAPRLIGRDPIDINGCELACLPTWRGLQSTNDYALIRAFGAIEIALWDIRGKAWGRPLYELLGGAVRKKIPFTDYFAFRAEKDGVGGESTPREVVDYCLRLREEHGTTYFEGKFGTADPRPSLETVRSLRAELGPEAMIRIDSNRAYSLATARSLARALEDLDIRNWEDPVGTSEEMAALRRHTSIPFSSHNVDLARAVALGVPDALVTDVAIHGGINRMIRFIGACEAMGVDCWCYSGDAGIGSAAYLHVCAAMSWMREPGQSLFRMQPLDVIEEGPFRPRNNVVAVPEGPGLGVTLSPERLAHCHRLFLDEGPANKHHDPAAPDRYRRMPLS